MVWPFIRTVSMSLLFVHTTEIKTSLYINEDKLVFTFHFPDTPGLIHCAQK